MSTTLNENLLLAIPLAGTLVSRLQRLRQAALQLAIGGTVGSFPADRARDEVGDLTRTFLTMQDRLQQQEEIRRAFLATASHELRTPLASLRGRLEMLEEDLADDSVDLAVGTEFSALAHNEDIDAVLTSLRPGATEPSDPILLSKIHASSC